MYIEHNINFIYIYIIWRAVKVSTYLSKDKTIQKKFFWIVLEIYYDNWEYNISFMLIKFTLTIKVYKILRK